MRTHLALPLAAMLALSACGSSDTKAGTAADAATTETATGACKIAGEVEPNEDRDHAGTIKSGTKISGCDGDNDKDFYSFTAPADTTGGYVKIQGTSKDAIFGYTIWTGVDNIEIGKHFAANKAADDVFYVAVAAGAKLVFDFGTDAPALYDVTVTYTKVADATEPNDTIETAKGITVGTKVTGKMFAGFNKGKQEGTEDWYKFTTTKPGKLSILVNNVPTNLGINVELYDAKKDKLGGEGSPNAGASVDWAYDPNGDDVKPADYYLKLNTDGTEKWLDEKMGDHLTRDYELTVNLK